MGNSVYDRELITTTRTLSVEDFENAWMLRERTAGALRDSKAMTVIYAVLGVAFLATNIPDMIRFQWEAVIVGMLEFLLCAACIIYQQMILPQRIQNQANVMYRSNQVLQETETVILTRDGYTLKNKYETVTGFWSETAFCAENERYMIFCGGLDREMIVVTKEEWSEEQRIAVSEKMQETFAGRYKQVREKA